MEPITVVTGPSEGGARRVRSWFVDDPGLRAGLDAVAARNVRDEIARLSGSDYRHLGRGGHIVCGLLADMAATRLLFPGSGRGGGEAVRLDLMRAATRTTVARAVHQLGTRDFDAVLTVVRLAAVAACPNPDAHPAVRQACVDVGDRPSWAWRLRQVAIEAA